jgi:Mn-containing catalase
MTIAYTYLQRGHQLRYGDQPKDTLLQLAVLDLTPVEYVGQMIQERMDDKRACLFRAFVSEDVGMDDDGQHTYSIKYTVLQPACGPRSLSTTSSPPRTPAAVRMVSSFNGLVSPWSVSFCRST